MSHWYRAAAMGVMLALAGCGTTAMPPVTPTALIPASHVTVIVPPVSPAVAGVSGVATAASTSNAAALNTQPTGSTLSLAELKYRLINQLAGGSSKAIAYCDRDYWPVSGGLGGEQQKALKTFPTIQQDQATYQAILSQLNLISTDSFTPDQQLLVYREYKVLATVSLQPVAAGYNFVLSIYDHNSSGSFAQVSGIMTADGTITIEQTTPVAKLECPICLVAGTLIDTPNGQVAVKDLQVGMSVWTLDQHGDRQAVLILKAAHVAVPFGHVVVHLRLSDGRELWASPPHPTADGRPLGSLQMGDLVDGATVTSVERVQYPDDSTYDILPAGDTSVYWANGILMKSTLINSAALD